MDKELFEQEIKMIQEKSIFFLFGYYSDSLRRGLMNRLIDSWSLTEEQAKEVENELWKKLSKMTEVIKDAEKIN